MDPKALDWRLIRSFLAAMDAGSLLGAARRCGTHQPTLSRHISELEQQLGVPLFERTGRGLIPTASAQAILPAARQMSQAADELQLALGNAQGAPAGPVRISCSQVAAAFLLPECLVSLREAWPGLEVELVSTNEVSSLHRREADIALRFVRPTQGTLIMRSIGAFAIGAYASRSYLDKHGTPMRMSDLASHTLIGLDRDDVLIRGLREAGLETDRARFAFRSDDQVATIQLVRSGGGIGFLPVQVAKRLDRLTEVLRMVEMPAMPAWLVVHRDIGGNPAIRAAYDHLARVLSELTDRRVPVANLDGSTRP